jgi:hypothetical protein
LIDQEATMSKLARALVFGAMVAAMNLAGMTTVAQAHTNDDPASKRHRALGQLELLTAEDHAVASREQPTDAVQRFRRGERASQEQPTRDAATRAALAQEQSYSFYSYRWAPANKAPAPVRPVEPTGHPVSFVAWLGVLAAVLALAGGLVVLAARRAGRKVQAGQAA